nr:MAG TPA: hypothetical protein [Caudoviricetes sp.]
MGKIKLYHNNSEIKTLKDFADYNQVVFDKEFTLNILFDENKDLIFSQYSSRDKIRLAKKLKKEISNISVRDLKISDELPCPCYIMIDITRVKYIIDTHKTEVQVPTNSVIAFQNEEINKILKDPEATYKQARRIRSGVKVLGWFKSLYSLKHSENSNGDIGDFYNSDVNFIDLSSIVVNLSTSVNSQGGSFSITFPHIPVYTKTNTTAVNVSSNTTTGVQNNTSNGDYDLFITNGIVAQWLKKNEVLKKIILAGQMKNYRSVDSNSLHIKSMVYSQDYISWLVQSNDLLFISFRDMDEITDDNIAGNEFDMICLVDSVSIQRNGQGNCSVTVTGRDLMKLLMEDSSMYFPAAVSNNSGNRDIFNNTETVNHHGDFYGISNVDGEQLDKGLMRGYSGFIEEFYEKHEFNLFTIEYVIKSVMSKLANIQIVPNDLFSSWAPRRTTFGYYNPKITKESDVSNQNNNSKKK